MSEEETMDLNRFTGEWVSLGPNNGNHKLSRTAAMEVPGGVFLRETWRHKVDFDSRGNPRYDYSHSVTFGFGMKIGYLENHVALVPLDYESPEATTEPEEESSRGAVEYIRHASVGTVESTDDFDHPKEDPYTRNITHTFDAGDEEWAVICSSDTSITIEETRKNGQEDCHMYAEVHLVDGEWKIDEVDSNVEEYSGPSTIEAIEAFFDEHGPPAKDNTYG